MLEQPQAIQKIAPALVRERRGLLRTISGMLDVPMTILSIVWVILMVIDFAGRSTDTLQTIGLVIWGLFLAQFALEFWIAPHKLKYLRKNWLTAIALILPAFRILRAFRALRLLRVTRLGRSVGLLRWITSVNRGMKVTRRAMQRRGLAYVLAITLLIDLTGAAAIYQFESPAALESAGYSPAAPENAISSFGEAIWWTSMMMTTMGSNYSPKTTEGRITALLLAVYAFAIFGYITATVASLIIQTDRQSPNTFQKASSSDAESKQLRALLVELRSDLNSLKTELARIERLEST